MCISTNQAAIVVVMAKTPFVVRYALHGIKCPLSEFDLEPYQQHLHSLSIPQFLSQNLHEHYERPTYVTPHVTILLSSF